jgi:hypothetical protein
MAIWPEASSRQNNMAAVSARGRTLAYRRAHNLVTAEISSRERGESCRLHGRRRFTALGNGKLGIVFVNPRKSQLFRQS